MKFIRLIRLVIRQFGNLVAQSRHEHAVAAAAFIVSGAFDLLRGALAASMIGWTRSYLGSGYRVLGSKGISVGKNASIKRDAWIEAVFTYNKQSFEPQINIGQRFIAADRLHLSAVSRIVIGDDCLFGSDVYISDHNHGVYKGDDQSLPTVPPAKRELVSQGEVKIGNNVWIGNSVIIVGPVSIGDGAVIGANSIVTRDVPSNVMAAGAPLRIIKSFNSHNRSWGRSDG